MPSRGLPAATRSSGDLDAVVDRVADHVGQRIGELLDRRSCRPRSFSPVVSSWTFLPVFAASSRTRRGMRENTDLHRLGADRHDAFLQLAGALRQDLEAVHAVPACWSTASSSTCWLSIAWVITSSPTMLTSAVDLVEIDPDRRRLAGRARAASPPPGARGIRRRLDLASSARVDRGSGSPAAGRGRAVAGGAAAAVLATGVAAAGAGCSPARRGGRPPPGRRSRARSRRRRTRTPPRPPRAARWSQLELPLEVGADRLHLLERRQPARVDPRRQRCRAS